MTSAPKKPLRVSSDTKPTHDSKPPTRDSQVNSASNPKSTTDLDSKPLADAKKKSTAKVDARVWSSLTPALSEWILEAVDSMGFARMTPVQASTIPLFMGNKDVVVEAVTGSGKTLSFLIPMVERLLRLEEPIKRHHIGGIIISPTRELATQIHAVLLSLLRFHAPSAAALDLITEAENKDDSEDENDKNDDATPPPKFPPGTLKIIPHLLLGGNTPPAQDLAHFLTHSPNLLIATPGRLLELLSSPHVHCPQSSFEALILDEADRLLDLGFQNDLTKILQRLPKQRRTGLFSASVSEAVDSLVRLSLRNPVRIAVKVRSRTGEVEGRTPASLRMGFIVVPAHHKFPALLQLLRDHTPRPMKTIVYLSTCAAVDYFQHILPKLLPLFNTPTSHSNDLAIVPLHGKHTAQVRQRNFARFVDSTRPAMLLTTDLAARGLDIPSVDLTVQLDPPSDTKAFLHRAGRAGRAGRRGLALVMLTPGREAEEYPSFLAVRKTPVEEFPLPLNIAPSSTSEALSAGAPAHPSDSSTSLSRPVCAESTATPVRTLPLSSLAAQITSKIQALAQSDRALHDKAQRSFVSWVRAYTKHEAKSIFRVTDVNWHETASAWGLLRMPKMPELHKIEDKALWNGDRSLGLSIDLDRVPYVEKERERRRVEELREFRARMAEEKARDAEEGTEGKRKRKESWSANKDAKDVREERRAKRAKKKEKEREAKMSVGEKARAGELKGMIEAIRGGALDEGEWEGFGD